MANSRTIGAATVLGLLLLGSSQASAGYALPAWMAGAMISVMGALEGTGPEPVNVDQAKVQQLAQAGLNEYAENQKQLSHWEQLYFDCNQKCAKSEFYRLQLAARRNNEYRLWGYLGTLKKYDRIGRDFDELALAFTGRKNEDVLKDPTVSIFNKMKIIDRTNSLDVHLWQYPVWRDGASEVYIGLKATGLLELLPV